MVVELKMANDEWESFMAARLPVELDDAIKKHHADFYLAQKTLTPQELQDILPISFPMTHRMPDFPGVAKYPIDTWVREGSPKLTEDGWSNLCMKIARKNLRALHEVFDVADRLKKKRKLTRGSAGTPMDIADASTAPSTTSGASSSS